MHVASTCGYGGRWRLAKWLTTIHEQGRTRSGRCVFVSLQPQPLIDCDGPRILSLHFRFPHRLVICALTHTYLCSKLAMRASQSYFPSGSHLCLADHTSPTKSSGCIQIDHAAQHQPSSQSPMIFMQHPGCNATAHDVHMQSVAHGQHQDGYFTTMNASQDQGYGPLTPGAVSQSVSYAFSQDPLTPTPNMRGYTGPSEPVRIALEPYGQGQMPVFVHENTFDTSKSNLHDLDVIQGRALFWAPPVRYRQRIAQACECCRKRKSKASRSYQLPHASGIYGYI